ncbi:hypothetical protein TrVFT333_010526 [Trichoderma virens FT-333]|nr:hypothetical protein TrVFT333_010526 [Trichoderma virens FT-333]
MAELYKKYARWYMMEGLYHFLEEKQTEEIEATQAEPREIHQYMFHVMVEDGNGCLSRLWDLAIEWAQKKAKAALHDYRGFIFDTLQTRKFNLWWLRAANARGHAEWLLQERRDSTLVGHSNPIEWWRLLPPGLVGQYDNSCVIWSWFNMMDAAREDLVKRDAASEDKMEPIIDVFGQEFNIASENARGKQSRAFGWPYHSFVYGAPEFVYRTLAENSTTSSLIGLLPTDNVGSYPGNSWASISVYDRYMRRGISSTLDPSCPEHYRTLARCADDILAESEAERRVENIISRRYTESCHLSSLLAALKQVLDKRVHMALQEANDMDFEGVTFACINFFIGKMQQLLDTLLLLYLTQMAGSSEPHRRTPYESEDRLQDETKKQLVSAILGLDDDQLTNSKPLPLPQMAGAGKVKKFRNETPVNNAVNSSGVPGSSAPIDVEMANLPAQAQSQRDHPGGYPSLASFIGSDKDFFIFRRFSALSARNLLYLQDELLELESRLQEIDLKESLSQSQQDLWNLHSRREDSNQSRKALMKEIRIKLQEYENAVQSQVFMLALEPAPSIHVESIANWYQYFRVKKEEGSSPRTAVEYYSTDQIKHVARVLLTLIAAIFAILPIPVLIYFTSRIVKIIIVSIFAVIFTAAFSVMTNRRTPEIFATMAAYVSIHYTDDVY